MRTGFIILLALTAFVAIIATVDAAPRDLDMSQRDSLQAAAVSKEIKFIEGPKTSKDNSLFFRMTGAHQEGGRGTGVSTPVLVGPTVVWIRIRRILTSR